MNKGLNKIEPLHLQLSHEQLSEVVRQVYQICLKDSFGVALRTPTHALLMERVYRITLDIDAQLSNGSLVSLHGKNDQVDVSSLCAGDWSQLNAALRNFEEGNDFAVEAESQALEYSKAERELSEKEVIQELAMRIEQDKPTGGMLLFYIELAMANWFEFKPKQTAKTDKEKIEDMIEAAGLEVDDVWHIIEEAQKQVRA